MGLLYLHHVVIQYTGSRCVATLLLIDSSGKWVVSITPRPLYPREITVVLTVWEAEWTPVPVRTVMEKRYLPLSVFERGTIHSLRHPASKAYQGDNISRHCASCESLWGNEGMALRIHNLGCRKDWVVSFMSRPPYHLG